MEKLIILGAGGFAREVMWIALKTKLYEIVNFYDETIEDGISKQIHSIPIIKSLENYANVKKIDRPSLICGVGSNNLRAKWADQFSNDFDFITLIDPDARIGPNVKIGQGSVVTAGCILTVDITIGGFVNINLNCTIGHDTIIGNYCNISPGCGISGNVKISEGVDIGTGVEIIPETTIGAWSIIGAGAVVTKDIDEKVLAVGMPAKIIKKFV